MAVSLGGPLGSLFAGEQQTPSARRPNIIFILADDWGLDLTGCYGSDQHKDRTPNIDALAAGGIRFERCYSAPVCGPSRYMINTGRYPFRAGGPVRYKNEYPLARILKDAGYDTCHAGKLGQIGGTPANWGFDEYIESFVNRYYWDKSYIKNGQRVETPEEVYLPYVNHQFVVDFLRRHAAKDSAPARPFYVYYASNLPHVPNLRTPDSKPGETDRWAFYNDNIAYLDKQVGALVAELDKLGQRENTLIVFSGDNGSAPFSGTIGGRKINGKKTPCWKAGPVSR